jgi:hypothetical protein
LNDPTAAREVRWGVEIVITGFDHYHPQWAEFAELVIDRANVSYGTTVMHIVDEAGANVRVRAIIRAQSSELATHELLGLLNDIGSSMSLSRKAPWTALRGTALRL